MTRSPAESHLISEALQLHFPRASAVSVAASDIRSDESLARRWICSAAHRSPPLADRGRREYWCVVIATDVNPDFVTCQIVDAVTGREEVTCPL